MEYFFDPLKSVWTSHETLKPMCDVAFFDKIDKIDKIESYKAGRTFMTKIWYPNQSFTLAFPYVFHKLLMSLITCVAVKI